jgi:hypothetical protein
MRFWSGIRIATNRRGAAKRKLVRRGTTWPGVLGAILSLHATAMSAAAAPPDNVSPLKSRFTTIGLDTCTVVRRHPDGNSWRCDGLPDYPVYLAEGDLRFYMSFGPRAEKQKAATQTLGPFNTVFRDKRNRITIEWRYVRRGGKDLPYAAIVRYFTSRDGTKGQALIVTRISDQEACHVAYVDALANPSAIALARSIADERARTFSCKDEPTVVGATGRSPL